VKGLKVRGSNSYHFKPIRRLVSVRELLFEEMNKSQPFMTTLQSPISLVKQGLRLEINIPWLVPL
jgi:hypothetical protein